MDGGGVTAPKLGTWTEEGSVVERVGIPPGRAASALALSDPRTALTLSRLRGPLPRRQDRTGMGVGM